MQALSSRFGQAMAALGCGSGHESGPCLLLAVSGGGDSMALLHLARLWSRDPRRLLAVTVDHGLRAAAAEEARQVAAWCRALDVPHRILRHRDSLPGTGGGGLQARARMLRHHLLAQAALEGGAARILMAHTLDDQAETVLMRRQHGSGDAGLAGIPALSRRFDLPGTPSLVRPLLDVTGAELRAWLVDRGCGWIDDPSNLDRRFERVRVRQALRDWTIARQVPAEPMLRAIAAGAARRRHVSVARDRAADTVLDRALARSPHGYDRLSAEALLAAGPELAGHALRRLLWDLGGDRYPPRRAAVGRLLDALAAGTEGATLGGCRLRRHGAPGRYLLLRDPRRPMPELLLLPGRAQTWGGVFAVASAPTLPTGLVLRELGRVGLRRVTATLEGGDRLSTVPAPARDTLPAVFAGSALLALPTLDCGLPDGPIRLTRLLPRRSLQATRGVTMSGSGDRPRGSACSDGPGILFTERSAASETGLNLSENAGVVCSGDAKVRAAVNLPGF